MSKLKIDNKKLKEELNELIETFSELKNRD
jgi:hypothetical protein